MIAQDRDDDPLASRSDAERDSGDACFSDDEGNETDCSSVSSDDLHAKLCEMYADGSLDELEDVGAWLLNEEEHPPEHYLAEEANLDPSCLRQRRYSPRTQEKLDWVKEHWEQ
jgi:hypothetical protein